MSAITIGAPNDMRSPFAPSKMRVSHLTFGSHIVTRFRTSPAAYRWRALLSHGLALAIGTALTLTFGSHAAPGRNVVLARDGDAPASEFDRALQAARLRMGSEMCVSPSGNADVDFARAMIPHHQGAIEMARLELLHGRDARLRRLAQGIIVEQDQEITLMRRLLDGGLPPRGVPADP